MSFFSLCTKFQINHTTTTTWFPFLASTSQAILDQLNVFEEATDQDHELKHERGVKWMGEWQQRRMAVSCAAHLQIHSLSSVWEIWIKRVLNSSLKASIWTKGFKLPWSLILEDFRNSIHSEYLGRCVPPAHNQIPNREDNGREDPNAGRTLIWLVKKYFRLPRLNDMMLIYWQTHHSPGAVKKMENKLLQLPRETLMRGVLSEETTDFSRGCLLLLSSPLAPSRVSKTTKGCVRKPWTLEFSTTDMQMNVQRLRGGTPHLAGLAPSVARLHASRDGSARRWALSGVLPCLGRVLFYLSPGSSLNKQA